MGITTVSSRDYPVQTESRKDAAGPENAGASLLPLSFALVPTGRQSEALVRVRGYRKGEVRDYRGERFDERSQDSSTSEPVGLCDAEPDLSPGHSLGLSVREVPASGASSVVCGDRQSASAVAVASIQIEQTDTYTLLLDQLSPGGAFRVYAQPILAVASSCEDLSTTVACAAASAEDTADAFELKLEFEPGRYWVLVSNQIAAAMEANLVLTRAGSSVRGSDSEMEREDRASNGAHGSEDTMASAGTSGVAESAVTEEPRLIIEGKDVTPKTEPDPSVAIDLLARVKISSDTDRSLLMRLDGDCFGVMADIAGARSCIDTGELVSLKPARLDSGAKTRHDTSAGTWDAAMPHGCEGASLDAESRVCIQGGAFSLGDSTIITLGADAAVPERVVTVDPFYLDRAEFSVARFRAVSEEQNWDVSDPMYGFGPLDFEAQGADGNYCTYSPVIEGTPLFPERENLPVTCVSWHTARAVCRALGGDLPTVVQWEYAAGVAGKEGRETLYPWGNEAPDCSTAVFARWGDLGAGDNSCFSHGFGPVDVADSGNDVTVPGLVAMGGNVAEWTLDSHRAYSDPCWTRDSMHEPSCLDDTASLRTVKGGAWRQSAAISRIPVRLGVPTTGVDDAVGFRCAYPTTGE